MDEYALKVREVFETMGHEMTSIHSVNNKADVLKEADGIVVGGGNTFALLSRMYEHHIIDMVRERVQRGVPYIGWSAGANLACPTIMTTNDMPIIQPPSFEALNLLPFQINPHYHELKFENQGGETRRERLEEFIALHPHRMVIGLPEGTLLKREGSTLTLEGSGVAKVYQQGKPVLEISTGSDSSNLLPLG
jgi:dipeptidase E